MFKFYASFTDDSRSLPSMNGIFRRHFTMLRWTVDTMCVVHLSLVTGMFPGNARSARKKQLLSLQSVRSFFPVIASFVLAIAGRLCLSYSQSHCKLRLVGFPMPLFNSLCVCRQCPPKYGPILCNSGQCTWESLHQGTQERKECCWAPRFRL